MGPKAFEEYLKLSENAHLELRKAAISFAIDTPLQVASVAANVHWNPGEAEKIVADLKESGIESPQLFDAMRAFGRSADVRGVGYAYLVDKLSARAKDAKDMILKGELFGFANSPETQESALMKLAKAIETLGEVTGTYTSPTLKLLVNETELAIAAWYDAGKQALAVEQVNMLTNINEAALRGLASLACQLEKDVKTLHAAEGQLAKAPKDTPKKGMSKGAKAAIAVGTVAGTGAVVGIALSKALNNLSKINDDFGGGGGGTGSGSWNVVSYTTFVCSGASRRCSSGSITVNVPVSLSRAESWTFATEGAGGGFLTGVASGTRGGGQVVYDFRGSQSALTCESIRVLTIYDGTSTSGTLLKTLNTSIPVSCQ